MSDIKSKKYEIIPTETYKIIRFCSGCGKKSVYHNTNNLPIYSRISIDMLNQSEYEALQRSDLEIVKRYGQDKKLFQQNGVKIFKELSYIIKEVGVSDKENIMQFYNPYQIKIRNDKLVAECLEISRSQAKKILETGRLKIRKYI